MLAVTTCSGYIVTSYTVICVSIKKKMSQVAGVGDVYELKTFERW